MVRASQDLRTAAHFAPASIPGPNRAPSVCGPASLANAAGRGSAYPTVSARASRTVGAPRDASARQRIENAGKPHNEQAHDDQEKHTTPEMPNRRLNPLGHGCPWLHGVAKLRKGTTERAASIPGWAGLLGAPPAVRRWTRSSRPDRRPSVPRRHPLRIAGQNNRALRGLTPKVVTRSGPVSGGFACAPPVAASRARLR